MKGQVIAGRFGEIIVRQKSDEEIELGELLIAENKDEKILLQAYDLIFGSQISQQNLELISGMKLEEGNSLEFMEPNLRNYKLALLKNILSIKGTKAKASKNLPAFFSEIREIKQEDLTFLTKPKNPLKVGNLRSGTKDLKFPVYLPGEETLTHHILITGTTGKGKSLDENEEVLIKTNNSFLIKSIGELVNNKSQFKDSEVLSMNPKNYTTDLKKITKFVKHKAPQFMYKVISKSGREIVVTGDHNLYVMRNGRLTLLKTNEVTKKDYLPLPTTIDTKGNLEKLNLFELLKENNKIFVCYNKKIIPKLKSEEECIKILSKEFSQPKVMYKEFVKKENRIRITVLHKLLKEKLSDKDLISIQLTDHLTSTRLKALYPITKDFLELIGYYIAEGYCPNENCFKISCSEETIKKDLIKIFTKLKLTHFQSNKKNKCVDFGVSSSIFTKILKNINVGRISGEKRLPNFFMNISNEKLKLLLRTYFEGDGGVDKNIKEKRKNFRISTTSKSKTLANDLCLALYKFGIFAINKKRICIAKNAKHKGDWYFRIIISGQNNLKLFSTKVGFKFQRKNSILKGKLNYKGNTNIDVIPIHPEEFKKRRLKTELYQKQFASKLGYCQQTISLIESGNRRPSRELFEKVILKFDEFKDLSQLLKFRWDQIKEIKKVKYDKQYVYDLTIKDNKTFLAGHGGVFVHNSNLMSNLIWDTIDKDYCALLVLDPHDEYYGRNKIGLKDHPSKKIVYYSSKNIPVGQRTLKINLQTIKPEHIAFLDFTPAQIDAMNTYYKEYKNEWIKAIILEKPVKIEFHEATTAVLKRKITYLLDLDFDSENLYCEGIFDTNAGETTIKDICGELEKGGTVIIDTSNFSGQAELLIGSLIATELLKRYKNYKIKGESKEKPIISIVLEEAPRVLGKEVLDKGSNIFATIAREGRKFKVGLIAITQMPSLIPRVILANMNTKIILGTEMNSERQAIIESAAQDMSSDNRAIASLDKGEAIISSNFARFALPVSIPFFDEEVLKNKTNKTTPNKFEGVKLG